MNLKEQIEEAKKEFIAEVSPLMYKFSKKTGFSVIKLTENRTKVITSILEPAKWCYISGYSLEVE